MAAQVGEDKVMVATPEDRAMAAQVGDREMVATPEDKAMAAQAEDKTIAEEQSADAPDLSITQTHQSYVPSHRQV